MKRQAGPREPGEPGRVGPGREARSEREVKWWRGLVVFLPGAMRFRRKGKGRRSEAEEGLENSQEVQGTSGKSTSACDDEVEEESISKMRSSA
jgi:hypothetical protein